MGVTSNGGGGVRKMLPTFEDMMLPILEILAESTELKRSELLQRLRERFASDPNFKTTDEEFDELVPSRVMPKFVARTSWATTYLFKAGLIRKRHSGVYGLTDEGRKVVFELRPKRVDTKFLMRYKSFLDFIKGSPPSQSPEDELWEAYESHRERVINALHERIRRVEPEAFELIAVEVLVRMGYGGNIEDAAKVVGKPGDEGVDGVINVDPLGLDSVYIQAKRWSGTVGRPEVQKFVGALTGKGASKGVLITSGTFSDEAKQYVSSLGNIKVVLIDGRKLAELMYRYGVGVTTHATLEIKKVDNDYFEELGL